MRDLPVLELNLQAPETFGNLAEKLDVAERRTLATDLIELIKVDEGSMSEWLGKAQGYLKTVKAGTSKSVTTNSEQQGSGEGPPPSTEITLAAVIQFSARATAAILGEPDLAKASEPGGEPLASWVSSQLRTRDPHWTLETDPLVMHMSVTGLSWRKRSFDDFDKEFHSHFLPCTDVIINANVRSVERAPRITHQFIRYPYEIERSISRKHWVDYSPVFDDADTQAPKNFYELDAWLDFDGDGIDEPWTVVISRDDNAEVVKIVPRWSKKTVVDKDDILFFNPIRRFYPYRMLSDPEGGFFPMGFGELLSRVEGSADRLLAAIVDTAETESENGGILAGGGVGLPDSIELKGNRIQTVNTDGRPLADMFQGFPIKSVSQGSVTVLEKLMTLGDRLSGTLNLLENAPASMTATLAKGIIDTGSQIQSAVHRRIILSMTQEFRMFVQMADAYDQLPEGVTAQRGQGVEVTADPQLATEMHRSALAGVYMEMLTQAASGVPWKMTVLQTRLCQVLRLPNPMEMIGEAAPAQATPKEKGDIALGMMKLQVERMKVTAAVAVQLTQALKNMVDAGGGMIDQRMALLQMAQLENAVNMMMQDAGNAGTGLDGMAQQPGNQSAGSLPPPAPVGDGSGLPEQQPGAAADAGQGVGVQ